MQCSFWTIFVFVNGYYIIYYVQIVISVYSEGLLFGVFFQIQKLVQESVFNVTPPCNSIMHYSAQGRSCTVYIYIKWTTSKLDTRNIAHYLHAWYRCIDTSSSVTALIQLHPRWRKLQCCMACHMTSYPLPCMRPPLIDSSLCTAKKPHTLKHGCFTHMFNPAAQQICTNSSFKVVTWKRVTSSVSDQLLPLCS